MCGGCWLKVRLRLSQTNGGFRGAFVCRWKLIRYHFVKLDTWLEGTCKSFCKQHDWKKLNRTRRSPTSKKSVFASQTDSPQSDAEEGASDHDSDNDSCVVKPN